MRKFIVPLMTVVVIASMVLAGCAKPVAEPTPAVPTPAAPTPGQQVLDMRGAPTTLPESAVIPEGDTYPIRVVEIGQLEPMSGAYGAIGMTDTQGARTAVEVVNNDGGVIINNERVFFILYEYDDRSDPKLSMAGAELMKDRGIKVIHTLGVEMSIAIEEVTEPAKIVTFGYNWDLNSMHEGLHYTFASDCVRERLPFYSQYYVEELGAKKLGFITENLPVWFDTTEYMIKDFAARGCESVGNEIFEPDTTDFYTYLTKLKAKDMDALVVCAGPDTSALIAKQRLELNWPVQLLGTDVMYGEGAPFFKVAGMAGDGLIEQAWVLEPTMELDPWLADAMEIDLELHVRLNNILLEKYGRENYSPYQAVTVDYILMLAQAMEKAQSWDDGTKIRDAMETIVPWGFHTHNFL